MTSTCRMVRTMLAGTGPGALARDAAAQEHVAGCEPCFQFLEAIGELDGAFAAMPHLDVPDALVARLLARGELRGAPPEPSRAGSVMAAVAGVLRRTASLVTAPRAVAVAAPLLFFVALGLLVLVDSTQYEASQEEASAPAVAMVSLEPRVATFKRMSGNVQVKRRDSTDWLTASRETLLGSDDLVKTDASSRAEIVYADGTRILVNPSSLVQIVRSGRIELTGGTTAVTTGSVSTNTAIGTEPRDRATGEETGFLATNAPPTSSDLSVAVGAATTQRGESLRMGESTKLSTREGAHVQATSPAPRPAPELPPSALGFLAERERIDGLVPVPAEGYWSNTYVPGDRKLRQLHARLAGRNVRTHEAARRVTQPFDPPREEALRLHLQADRRGVTGPSRVLLQVGLAGSERRPGQRSPMSLAVVLDLRGSITTEDATTMRAVLDALAASLLAGDRFSLLAAGRGGDAIAVAPRDFERGRLAVKLEELLAAPEAGTELGPTVAAALEQACAGEDPSGPLGSTAVLLVTGQPFVSEVAELEALAHTGATRGIPLSVMAIGEAVSLPHVDRLVLAGQGTRRLLLAPSDAESAVEAELSSAGRAVARAVRLSIRLAPGVELLDIVGSERLQPRQAEATREAEQSLDLELARRLGIQADRGVDEDGVQILIPAFYSGDRHAILLDLLVPGPGPVAEVRARYKDLVTMRKGVAHDRLELGRSAAARGILQVNVLKNLLARRLGRGLEKAGALVAVGDAGTARTMLAGWRALLAELPRHLPGVKGDADLAADMALLDDYLGAIDRGAADTVLADSLGYAGRLKVLAPPFGETEEAR